MTILKKVKVRELLNFYLQECNFPLIYTQNSCLPLFDDFRKAQFEDLLGGGCSPYHYYLCAYDTPPHILVVRDSKKKELGKYNIILVNNRYTIV